MINVSKLIQGVLELCFARFWGSISLIIFYANSFLAIDEPWDAIKFAEGCAIIIFAVYAAIRTKGKEL